MNFKWDLKKPLQELKRRASTLAHLRKRSIESIARPRADKNITSKDDRLKGI